jgi:hypothetical protein
MIDPVVRKEVDKQNAELRERLGEVEGLPLYKWFRSDMEELSLPQLVWDNQEDPKPVQESFCACGVDKIIHAHWCKSLSVVRNKAERKSVAPHLRSQWVLCRWMEACSEFEWNLAFGDQFPYPRQGYYFPVSARGNELALKIGDYPRMATTMFIIGAFLEQRKLTEQDHLNEMVEGYDKKVTSRRQRYKDMFKDFAPVGDDKPGTKNNTSFPSVLIKA